jgi:enoyl-[acyl-carrier protein] reductase I
MRSWNGTEFLQLGTFVMASAGLESADLDSAGLDNAGLDSAGLSAAVHARRNGSAVSESSAHSGAAPAPGIGLMQGKRGLVMGVANDHSIAWGIAKTLHAHGASLAFTYQGNALGKRVSPLAASLGSTILEPCDVEDGASVDAVFARIGQEWGGLDFVVHAIAFSDKNELKGRYADTTRENFTRTMLISCFSFTEIARRAAALMAPGGSLVTLTYDGSNRVMPNYNVMGVAKAALEASVRYLAADFGPSGIRVNAISAGPVRTLAGAGISDARLMFNFQKRHAPLRRSVSIEEIGNAGLYLLSDLSSGVTGEIHYVDSGYNIVSMPHPEALKTVDAAEAAAESSGK